MATLEEILKHQHVGVQNAIKSRDLESLLGCPGTQIREETNKLRAKGIPVCTSNVGYYYSEDEEEIAHTIAALSSRIKQMQKARRGLRKALKKIEKIKEKNNEKISY